MAQDNLLRGISENGGDVYKRQAQHRHGKA